MVLLYYDHNHNDKKTKLLLGWKEKETINNCNEIICLVV